MKKILFLSMALIVFSTLAFSAISWDAVSKQVKGGDIKGAIGVCEASITAEPNDINARKFLAYLYYLEARYDDSIRISVESIGKEKKSNALFANYAGLSLMAQNKNQEAIKYFDQAIIADKAWYEPYNNKGIAYMELKDYSNAKNLFLTAYNMQSDEKDVKKKDINVYINYANSLISLKDYNEAIKVLGFADKVSPKNPSVNHNMAVAYFEKKDYKTAANLFKKICDANAKDISATKGAADSFLKSGNNAEAAKYYEKAVLLNPEFSSYYNLGIIFRQSGQFGKAVGFFKKAVELSPNNYEALNELGWAEFKSGDAEASIGSIKKSIDIKSDYLASRLNLATIYSSKNDSENAYTQWSFVTMLSPSNAIYKINLANEAKNIGKYDEAINVYGDAIKLDSKVIGGYYGLGTVYLEKALKAEKTDTANLNKALEALQKAAGIESSNSGVFVNLGVTYQSLGKYSEAITAYEKALKISPKNTIAKENLDNLKKFKTAS